MKKTIISILSAAVIAGLNSCVPLDTPPMDSQTDLTFWQDPSSAESVVNSCYLYMEDASTILYADAASDNAYCKVGGFTRDIGNGSYSTGDSYIAGYWKNRYTGIKLCNRLTDNIASVPGLSDAQRKRFIGEVKCIRAYHYFQLVSRFGDVPYFTHVLPIADASTISRTPKTQVVANILSELDEVLNGDYLPASYGAADQGRFTKWAAMALKARILLYEGNRWEDVKAVTSTIMSDSGLELFISYSGLFEAANEYNNEVILDVEYSLSKREHGVQYQFLPPSLNGYCQLAPLQELVDSYIMAATGKGIKETGSGYNPADPFTGRDPRLAATICYTGNTYKLSNGSEHSLTAADALGASSNQSPTGYYFKKYWDNAYRDNNIANSGLNIILIRYADVLLMRAEAAAELGELDATVWNSTIKSIRQRAGFSASAALDFPAGASADELKEIVRNERRCELAFEGLRMCDIYRWKIAETVLDGWCHGVYTGEPTGTDDGFHRVENRQFRADRNYLWAIPQSERDLNKNLTPNPNW